MKAIMLSVQPQWVKLIKSGTKKLEIRKSIPSCSLPIEVYIYETLGKIRNYVSEDAWGDYDNDYYLYKYTDKGVQVSEGLGQVVAKFTLNKVDDIPHGVDDWYLIPYWDLEKACLTNEQLQKYGGVKTLYAWHIDNLVIFDTPKALSEFYVERYAVMPNGVFPCNEPLTHAPQSYCFVEVSTNG